MKPLARLVALTVAALTAGGCPYVTGSLPPCPSVLRAPTLLTVQVSGAARDTPWARSQVRDSLYFRLTEPDGLSMWRYEPNLRRVQCVRVSEGAVEDWLATVEALPGEFRGIDRIDPADVPAGEVLMVANRRKQASLAVDELDSEGLAGARRLACLALDAFGGSFERALRRTSPNLVDRLGFPGACTA